MIKEYFFYVEASIKSTVIQRGLNNVGIKNGHRTYVVKGSKNESGSNLVPKVLIEVLKGSRESDVRDVNDALQCDAVATDRLRDRLQVRAHATLNLKSVFHS